MPRKASPLSSSTLSVYLTWSYIFIRHIIWVFLGASFYFLSICLLLFIILFFNKKFQELLLGCLNCMFDVCCVKIKTFVVVFEFSYFTWKWKVSKKFTKYFHIIFLSFPKFQNFWSYRSAPSKLIATDCPI